MSPAAEDCAKVYRAIAQSSFRNGLVPGEIERSRHSLSGQVGSLHYLKNLAYQPTGVVLGSPLPDPVATRRLWRLARLFEKRLAAEWLGRPPVFAYVPPASYHITLVNRVHFDSTDKASFTSLTSVEREIVEREAAAVPSGPIYVHLSALVLTSQGRLLAAGFPIGEKLQDLRRRFATSLPQLRANLPVTAHVKLGHVLVPLGLEQVRKLSKLLEHCVLNVQATLRFADLFTPAGRIRL